MYRLPRQWAQAGWRAGQPILTSTLMSTPAQNRHREHFRTLVTLLAEDQDGIDRHLSGLAGEWLLEDGAGELLTRNMREGLMFLSVRVLEFAVHGAAGEEAAGWVETRHLHALLFLMNETPAVSAFATHAELAEHDSLCAGTWHLAGDLARTLRAKTALPAGSATLEPGAGRALFEAFGSMRA